MRHSDRPQGPHGPAWILFAFLVLVLLAGALDARAAAESPDWHLYAGEAVVDTLDGTPGEAFTAGVWVLLHDSWEIERKDSARGTLVTAWKPVKHKLVKFAAGPSKVRVAVALKSVGPGRTEVRVLGGIASRDALGGAILPLAQRAGQHECQGYVEELKARLAEDRLSDGAPSASPRSAAEKR
jgi:hypothetical protein